MLLFGANWFILAVRVFIFASLTYILFTLLCENRSSNDYIQHKTRKKTHQSHCEYDAYTTIIQRLLMGERARKKFQCKQKSARAFTHALTSSNEKKLYATKQQSKRVEKKISVIRNIYTSPEFHQLGFAKLPHNIFDGDACVYVLGIHDTIHTQIKRYRLLEYINIPTHKQMDRKKEKQFLLLYFDFRLFLYTRTHTHGFVINRNG